MTDESWAERRKKVIDKRVADFWDQTISPEEWRARSERDGSNEALDDLIVRLIVDSTGGIPERCKPKPGGSVNQR